MRVGCDTSLEVESKWSALPKYPSAVYLLQIEVRFGLKWPSLPVDKLETPDAGIQSLEK